jgi:hypothetical protein
MGAVVFGSVQGIVADTKTLGDKLASGATWTREEVAKGFESLGHAINALGQKIGSSKRPRRST